MARCAEASAADEGLSNAEILHLFARRQLAKLSAPRSIALMRIVFSESLRDPDFAAQIYRDLHLPVLAQLTALFENWAAAGEAGIDDPEATARYFLSLTAGESVLGKLFGVAEGAMAEEEVGWRIDKFLDQFEIA